MLKNLFDKIMEKLNRKRFVYDRLDGKLYLTRYYIFLKERTRFPFNIFIHHFHKSDGDVYHDHPWAYVTLILRGGYYEWVAKFNPAGEKIDEVRVWRGPGHFRICSASSYHRIELCPGIDCWTMFMPGPQKRDWGFLVNNKWIQHERYLGGERT